MNFRRLFLIGLPYLWLLALFLIPFGIVLKISLSDIALYADAGFQRGAGGAWAVFRGAGFRELHMADAGRAVLAGLSFEPSDRGDCHTDHAGCGLSHCLWHGAGAG